MHYKLLNVDKNAKIKIYKTYILNLLAPQSQHFLPQHVTAKIIRKKWLSIIHASEIKTIK